MEYIVHLNVHIVCKMYVFFLTYTSKNIFLIFYVTLISMCKTTVLHNCSLTWNDAQPTSEISSCVNENDACLLVRYACCSLARNDAWPTGEISLLTLQLCTTITAPDFFPLVCIHCSYHCLMSFLAPNTDVYDSNSIPLCHHNFLQPIFTNNILVGIMPCSPHKSVVADWPGCERWSSHMWPSVWLITYESCSNYGRMTVFWAFSPAQHDVPHSTCLDFVR